MNNIFNPLIMLFKKEDNFYFKNFLKKQVQIMRTKQNSK